MPHLVELHLTKAAGGFRLAQPLGFGPNPMVSRGAMRDTPNNLPKKPNDALPSATTSSRPMPAWSRSVRSRASVAGHIVQTTVFGIGIAAPHEPDRS